MSGFFFNTKNSTYVVQHTNNPSIGILTGGNLPHEMEIYINPYTGIMLGEGFQAKFTNSSINGQFANKTIKTSPIIDIHQLRTINEIKQEYDNPLDNNYQLDM